MNFGDLTSALINLGKKSILEQLPFESPGYEKDDVRYRENDATLAYLLDLRIPQLLEKDGIVPEELEDQIIARIEQLYDPVTNYGPIRYHGDPYERGRVEAQQNGYWSYDGKETLRQKMERGLNDVYPEPDMFAGRCSIFSKGREAAWTHVNFQLSTWAGQRYMETKNNKYKDLQKKYLMRGLSMVTGQGEYTLVHDGKNILVQKIGPYLVPEVIYSFDTSTLPGPFTPLNWGTALLHKALVTYRETVSTF
jgi:hypothetical protein